jgi:hypothetical protein
MIKLNVGDIIEYTFEKFYMPYKLGEKFIVTKREDVPSCGSRMYEIVDISGHTRSPIYGSELDLFFTVLKE